MKPVIEKRKVFAIHEENHGVIGIADSVESAAHFVVENDWMTPDESVWCAHAQNYIPAHIAMDRLGYLHDDESFLDFCADMFVDKCKGYDWGFHLSSIEFYERRTPQ